MPVPLINAKTAGTDSALKAGRMRALPSYACDCHVHLFGRPDRYPLDPARTYTPGLAEVADAQALMRALGVERIVLVQPSAYGFDNACLLDGLARLGDHARGVAVLALDDGDNQLSDFHAAGVRGLRINFGEPEIKCPSRALADDLAGWFSRLAGTDWLIQVHAPADTLLAAGEMLMRSPCPLIIDHFGNVPASGLPDHPACRLIETLLKESHAYLKLSAPYRIVRDNQELAALRCWVDRLVARCPDRLLWGSDWPHTPPHGPDVDRRLSTGFRDRDTSADFRSIAQWFHGPDTLKRILVETPQRLFGFPTELSRNLGDNRGRTIA